MSLTSRPHSRALGQGAGQARKAAGASPAASVGMGTGYGLALLWCGWRARPLQHHGDRLAALGWARQSSEPWYRGVGAPGSLDRAIEGHPSPQCPDI